MIVALAFLVGWVLADLSTSRRVRLRPFVGALVVALLLAALLSSTSEPVRVRSSAGNPVHRSSIALVPLAGTSTTTSSTTTTTTAPPPTSTTSTTTRPTTTTVAGTVNPVPSAAARPAGPVADEIRAGFARFGAVVAEQAVDVATCESDLVETAEGNLGERGVLQIHPVHREMIERLGYSWDDMYRAGPNAVVAAELYSSEGWRPWRGSGYCHGYA